MLRCLDHDGNHHKSTITILTHPSLVVFQVKEDNQEIASMDRQYVSLI